MKVTIFYSWQSVSPNSTNRGFIERALNKAVESIKAEAEMVIEPCLERDVQGVPGTPDIAHTIFRKIDDCRIFVGDVSIINPASTNERKTPNPNVLIELGYAAKTLSWDYVICIYNTAYGSVKDLPFDLQTRLMCTYSVTVDQEGKAEERDKLASKLKAALKPMLQLITQSVVEDASPKTLSPADVSAKVKEFLSDDRNRIPLSELIINQGNSLAESISGPEFPLNTSSSNIDLDIKERLDKFEDISNSVLAIIVTGCYWGSATHERLWIDLLQRAANPRFLHGSFQKVYLNLRRYPALMLLYGGGMAAMAGEHYGTLLALLTKPKLVNIFHESDESPLVALAPHRILDKDAANRAWGQRWYAPLSEHLFSILREPFGVLLPDDRQYQRCFDRFEYLRTLLEVDLTGDLQSVGSYGWRWKHPNQDVLKEIETEERNAGQAWSPYKSGWFDGQRGRFSSAKEKVTKVVANLKWL